MNVIDGALLGAIFIVFLLMCALDGRSLRRLKEQGK